MLLTPSFAIKNVNFSSSTLPNFMLSNNFLYKKLLKISAPEWASWKLESHLSYLLRIKFTDRSSFLIRGTLEDNELLRDWKLSTHFQLVAPSSSRSLRTYMHARAEGGHANWWPVVVWRIPITTHLWIPPTRNIFLDEKRTCLSKF